MRIKKVQLRNYKRFTDLTISDIPDTCRLIVMIGPNGSGKSSLFDAFLLKSWASQSNYNISGNNSYAGYYSRTPDVPRTTAEMAAFVDIEFHSLRALSPNQWPAAFNIRSAYRNESDFQLQAIEAVQSSLDTVRFSRIIDADESVSDNYKRLTWKRQSDIDQDASEDMTVGQYRKAFLRDLQTALADLFTDPLLSLQDFGGIQDAGVFRFTKGAVANFHYKNLSGGEKAAFDLLLDVFVKRHEYRDAIYCIDEPEAHIATALQGPLLKAILSLVPHESQLWLATHSIGFVKQAYELMKRESNVVFLDFSNHDFDNPVIIRPQEPNRSFWQTTYEVALHDLADLIAPANIVVCEGAKSQADQGFDAKCYNKLFSGSHPDTLFVSYGSASEVENSKDLMTVLGAVAKGITTWRLVDRDDMSSDERNELIENGVRVLRRRELENYLYDPDVLKTFLKENDKEELQSDILEMRDKLLATSEVNDDVKAVSRDLFDYIKRQTRIPMLGHKRVGFALAHLVPALMETPCVFQELLEDVFTEKKEIG